MMPASRLEGALLRRPLFYTALAAGALIFFWNFFSLPDFLPQSDISRVVSPEAAPVFLGGAIDSEIERRKNFFGQRKSSFVLQAQRLWRAEDSNGQPVSGRVKVYVKHEAADLDFGDVVVIQGELLKPPRPRNPGAFDYRNYLESLGIRAIFYADKTYNHRVLAQASGWNFKKHFIWARGFLSRGISQNFSGRDSAFLKALFLGERSELDEDFKDLFIKTGTMHILAVSGFNIGFLISAIYFLLRPLPLPRALKQIFLLAGVWSYCLLVGWQAPVVRASVMATVVIGADLAGRKQDPLNSLGLAALIILAMNPRQLFDVGFQLSFLAVYGLIQFSPLFITQDTLLPFERRTWRENVGRYVRDLFWVSFVALVITLPVTVQNFYLVTPLSMMANLIVVPLAMALFFLGVLYFLTFWWWPKLIYFVPLGMKFMLKAFTASLFAVESLPGSSIVTGKLHPALWILLVVGIAWILVDRRISHRILRAIILLIFLFNIFLSQAVLRNFDRKFSMTALDVGQGESIFFEFPHGGNLLVDAGGGLDSDKGRFVVGPFLKFKGISQIDALVMSHPQEDHVGGVPSVLEEFRVKVLLDAGTPCDSVLCQRIRELASRQATEFLYPTQGHAIEGFKNIRISVLNPSEGTERSSDVNNESLVLRIEYGQTSFLLTGDIQGPAMGKILAREPTLKSTVLKVPHHGAKLDRRGEAFVRAADPQFSIISVGRNNAYHQPASTTLDYLRSIEGNVILRTDESGSLKLSSDGLVVART